MAKLMEKFKSLLKTIFFFGLGCVLAPIFGLSYLTVRISQYLWLKFLGMKYPSYEFSRTRKIRSLVDTSLNPAIFHFLLHVNGNCDFNSIKEKFTAHIAERKTKTGELKFPKLRKKLISCWGNYAWVKSSREFDISDHVILSSANYRGRQVQDNNIQDFVSDIVMKRLPSGISPWQFIVIPAVSMQMPGPASEPVEGTSSTVNESYYILIRIHHLLIAEEENLHINEILMLNPDKSKARIEVITEPPRLIDLVEKPVHIPNLWTHLAMMISNRWNEFIYDYDPLESPDVDKKQSFTSLGQLFSIILITVVTVISDFLKGYKKTNNQLQYKIRFLVNLFRREAYKRNLSFGSVFDVILVSLNPVYVFTSTLKFLWWLGISLTILWPYYIFREFRALKEITLSGHTDPAATFVGFFYIYTPLMFCALIEFLQICSEIILAPKYIYEELFQSRSKEPNILQIKSYGARKVVAFSNSIDMTEIRKKIDFEHVGETEFIFGCLGGSVHNYLELFKELPVPSSINVTTRTLTKDYFLEKYSKTAHIGGLVLLQLPLQDTPNKDQIQIIRSTIDRVRRKQIAIYLLSLGQIHFDLLTSMLPEVWSKILINYFSVTFPITITEIFGDSTPFETIWGQKLNDLLLFRPPQSKTCLSLNIHRYGDRCRLAVMADSQLSPDHSKIASVWERNMKTITV